MTADQTPSRSQKLRSLEEILLVLGEGIRTKRKAKGLSQEDFAAECGLHRTEMGSLERGKTIPRLDTLLLASRHLGLPVSELLQGD